MTDKVRKDLARIIEMQKEGSMKYQSVTYGKGFALEVTPEDRGADVMHYLITGHLLGGRSLDGVEWKELEEDSDFVKLQRRRAAKLMRSMQDTKDTIRDNAAKQIKDLDIKKFADYMQNGKGEL